MRKALYHEAYEVPNGLMFAGLENLDTSETLYFIPLAQAHKEWRQLVRNCPEATLFHDDSWLSLLREAYGYEIFVAGIRDGSEFRAATLLARTKNPLRRRWVSLPFSDFCPPLATDAEALRLLLRSLSNPRQNDAYELRGVKAPPPWEVFDYYGNFTLDLDRPRVAIERSFDEYFLRKLTRAKSSGVSVSSGSGLEDIDRFYALQLETRRRLGVPAQPLSFFRLTHRLFSDNGDIQLWFAREAGADVAALVILRAGDQMHIKWAARRKSPSGSATYFLFWTVVCEMVGKARMLDLGRNDFRNQGLSRFKRQMGATAKTLPYSFFPKMPRAVSAEVLEGPLKLFAQLWRHLPLPICRTLGTALYQYLA